MEFHRRMGKTFRGEISEQPTQKQSPPRHIFQGCGSTPVQGAGLAEVQAVSFPVRSLFPTQLMTITLPSALSELVREKVASGLYANESEVVSEALRHEFGRDLVASWIREKAASGFAQLDAGEFEDITREELMTRLAKRRAA
jgi:antitoxin ParD1/3/4